MVKEELGVDDAQSRLVKAVAAGVLPCRAVGAVKLHDEVRHTHAALVKGARQPWIQDSLAGKSE